MSNQKHFIAFIFSIFFAVPSFAAGTYSDKVKDLFVASHAQSREETGTLMIVGRYKTEPRMPCAISLVQSGALVSVQMRIVDQSKSLPDLEFPIYEAASPEGKFSIQETFSTLGFTFKETLDGHTPYRTRKLLITHDASSRITKVWMLSTIKGLLHEDASCIFKH